MRRNQGVVIVRRKNTDRFFCALALCTSAFAFAQSPVPRESICTDILPQFNAQEPVGKFLETLRIGLQDSDARTLAPLFHPRLKIDKNQIAPVLEHQRSALGPPFVVTLAGIWSLTSSDHASQVLDCPLALSTGPLKIPTLYGYDHQVAALIDIQGKTEAGYVDVTLVHNTEGWWIGAFRWQNRTYLRQSAQDWITHSNNHAQKGLRLATYLERDLAQKLLMGSHFHWPLLDTVTALQAPQKTAWFDTFQALIPGQGLRDVATILVPKGPGLSLRFVVNQELPSHAIRNLCTDTLAKIRAEPGLSLVTTLRCTPLLPAESGANEGVMGSLSVQ